MLATRCETKIFMANVIHRCEAKYSRVTKRTACDHLVPLGVDLLRIDRGVGVDAGHVNVVRLHDLSDLIVDAQDGLALFVRLRQCGLELLVGRAESLWQTYTEM